MRIYDISDPENPIAAGFHDFASSGYDVFVSGDYAFVATTTAGLHSLKIAELSLHYGELYDSYAVAQSSTIYFAAIGETIEKVTLSVSETIDSDTLVEYYVSADGNNWESITPGVEHIITNTGRYLSWLAELSTIDAGVSPIVYSVAFDYVTIDVEMELLYPTHEAYVAELTPNFDWVDMSGAYGYLLQLDTSPSFTSLILNESLFFKESNYTIITPLDDGVTYYWKVAFYTDFSVLGRFSDTLSFTIGEEPIVAEFSIASYMILALTMVSISIVLMVKRNRRTRF